MAILEGLALLLSVWCSTANVVITISEITKLKRSTGAVGGHLIALEEINNNGNLLINYTLNLRVNDSGGEIQTAILKTLDITTLKSDDKHISFPLILGNRLSSVSTAVNPILGAFNKGQISAGATAISLSDTDRYPYFYRTIPSDALQAEGLILLCTKFNWNRIAIVYATDVYGTGLSLKLQEIAKEYNIDATSIAVSYEGDSSYTNAAQQIKDLQVYIIILIVHHESHVFDYFRDESVTGYPYYFLGVDAWLSTNTLKRWDNININNEFKGFIGTVPWQTNSVDFSFYNQDIQSMLNESKKKNDYILDSWNKYYIDGHPWFQTEIPGTKCVYGYDAMYVIAYLIEELGDDLINYIVVNNGTDNLLIDEINDIIIGKISFVGATGNVSFDENGDRQNGFYLLGNVVNNDSISYFGHFYRRDDGNIGYKIDESMIIWPDAFEKRGIIPSSDTIILHQLQTINIYVSVSMISLLLFSCIIAMGCMILLIYYQKNPIIKVVAWRMNVIMCFGAFIGYFGAILCGIDEEFITKNNILCNGRIWIIMVAFTLLFVPLFAKTCRLSVLFNAALRRSKTIKFEDKKLFIVVFICVFIDILLLIIFTSIQPLKMAYFDGEIEIIDELQNMQYIYGRCSVDDDEYNLSLSLYAFLFIFKLFELIWGLYFAFDLSRIRDHTNTLWKFNETGIQLLSILLIFIVFCVTIPLYVFSPINNPDLHFLIIAITAFLTGNIVISLNLFPRLLAVIRKNETKYMKSPIKKKIEMELAPHIEYNNNHTHI